MLDKGTTVAGYRIDGVLGQGGMGVVYEATQLSLDRRVALKLLATHLGEDPQFRERFRREALIQAGIDHPHIVTVYEAGEDPEGLFMAMRLVRGPNLKDMVISRELDAGRSLRILGPVAEALDAAHEAELIHRDIKPQNILVSGRDHAYLADFGLTKAPGEKSLTKTGQFVGTLDYISPEQIRGLRATSASDIYALAAVLYECLTGVVPYPKESEAAVLFAHMSDQPPKVTDERPELPAELDAVIARAMSKDPEQRHPSAGELLRDAEEAFGRRLRGVISTPGPLEGPEETGIRSPEGAVGTRESDVQSSDRVAGATAPGGPDATKLAAGADATKLAAAGEATKMTGAAGATKPGSAPAEAGTAPLPLTHDTDERAVEPGRRKAPAGALAAVAAGVVALAVVGFIVGSSGGSSEPEGTNSVSEGMLRVSYPNGWQEGGDVAEVPGLEPADAIELAAPGSGGAGLVAGRVDAAGPTLLPASLLEGLDAPPATDDAVQLGDYEAYRYRNLRPEGASDPVTLYVVPTTAGVAALACVGAPEAQRECEEVASSIQLRNAEAVGLGPSQEYADALNAAIGRLNSARAAGRSTLRAARTPGGQARAAGNLQQAYRQAAQALEDAPAGPAAAGANAAIVSALADTADAYERMASAANRGDRGRYSSARAAVARGEERVQDGLQDLRDLGYSVS